MFNPPRVEETDRSYLVRYLDWKLRSGKVTRVDIQTPDAGTKTLHQSDADTANTDWLPLPALYAAEFVVSTKRKGLELDLMAHMGPEEYVPVTARYEPDGRLVLVLGKPLSSLVPKAEDIPTPDQLKSQYGIGDVRNGTRTWKPYELHSLATALSLLSKEERSVMSGIEFVREAQAKKTIKATRSGASSTAQEDLRRRARSTCSTSKQRATPPSLSASRIIRIRCRACVFCMRWDTRLQTIRALG